MFSSAPTPPFSPVLIGGLFARPLPPSLLQPALNSAMAAIARSHPGLFERLSQLGAPVYLIDPVDLPLAFILTTDADKPRVKAVKSGEGTEVRATIRGPLLTLIDLLEGNIDGDALFFSRDLVIEGDTEAVVALRNAVDGVEVDLVAELTAAFGPLARPVRGLARFGQGLFRRAADDLAILHGALVAPTQRRVDVQAAKIRELEARLAGSVQSASRQRQRAART
ncbi:ubiquinone anaerobic biosynthesis accessory factor UbiT [Magnetovibrio sp.]|uniref:ubiquinone anaerobic biosynthesis accessory factor UbiT n=1 Tax=Magnetovibrio sp. TaxID=2024836 RepID=UPI002F93C239